MVKSASRFVSGIKVNRTIQFLTYSDILMLTGWGLINPIIAVFIADKIEGGTIELVGLATTTYFIIKSIVQIPVARYIDLKKGEWDDYIVMITGALLISLSAFLFAFIKHPRQVIAVQIINGLGGALSYPTWLAIFTRHVDKREEALEWSLYYTATDLGAAFAASIGALIASRFGYNSLFLIVGIMSLWGTLILAGIGYNIKKRKLKSQAGNRPQQPTSA